ncbi:hypothetical protein L209DRAFT_358662 [Thermothelomyces heterothallicus CBS 203.75]
MRSRLSRLTFQVAALLQLSRQEHFNGPATCQWPQSVPMVCPSNNSFHGVRVAYCKPYWRHTLVVKESHTRLEWLTTSPIGEDGEQVERGFLATTGRGSSLAFCLDSRGAFEAAWPL